jgi:uncharacterized protein (TIGR00661 family)
MRILYAIQGTGNGHLARATEIIPVLQRKCRVDLLVSGTQADVKLRYPVKYRLNGLSFIFGKKGGVDIWKTMTTINISKFFQEIKELPVEDYDLVVNDFEPVSAWACRKKNVPCISLSHQSSLLKDKVPKPNIIDFSGTAILKYYAPSNFQFGFHFAEYRKNIYTPVIRREIRESEIEDYGHYTVYLPSYSDEKLIENLSLYKNVRWQVFSKHNIRTVQHGNILIHPVSLDLFTQSIVTCTGVLCGAGFETPAEALYLGKKLMVIPMKKQLEQHFNAAALKTLGVPVISKLKPKNYSVIREWLENNYRVEVKYPDKTEQIINKIFEHYINNYQMVNSDAESW